MGDYYDRKGQPMALMEWARKLDDIDYKRIAQDAVGDVKVSTVWLGLDHSYGDGGPLIFESMVFGGKFSDEQRRYSTEDEARAGHAALLAEVVKAEGN